ncbi:hypothetical protein HPB47_024169 [Ixodes persulcatus]|uniref:Uncharacterized protein n=1 Tax=Ixodes persulcatus TaxID=34615 RepID=A0AC60Q7I4_IXOPE|nr:hypothetical protein HPB47_024169 [Ixodes persulcatus]
MAPGEATARRCCKMLRAETWRQVRFFKLNIRNICDAFLSPTRAKLMYNYFIDIAESQGERQWTACINNMPKKKERMKDEKAMFVNMTDLIIPDNVSKTLEKGPKYAVEPKAKTVDLIGMVHDVARKVSKEGRNACIAAGIRAVSNE